jgi:hypothetical protein
LRPGVFALKKLQPAMTENETGKIIVESAEQRIQRKGAKTRRRKDWRLDFRVIEIQAWLFDNES